MGLLLVSPAFLYSCTNKTEDPVLKISENSVNILQAESKTITLETNLELGVKVTDTSICKASINGNQVVITGKAAGTTYVRIYDQKNEENFKDILVVVEETKETYSLKVLDEFNKDFYVGEEFSFNADVYLSTLFSGAETGTLTLLDKNEYFLSLKEGHIFEEEGTIDVTITAPNYEDAKYTFSVDVVRSEYQLLKQKLQKIVDTNQYNFSFKANYGVVLSIEGVTTYNPNYYYNSYNDLGFAKDETGVFKFEFEDNSLGKHSSVVTTNGYLIDGDTTFTDLYNTIETINGYKSLSNLNLNSFEESNVNGDVYYFNDKENLSLVWNNILGFNGSASLMNVSLEDDAISYSISGKLTNGLELTFTGSIYDIGTAKEKVMDDFLSKTNHEVNKKASAEVTEIANKLKGMNYTIKYSDATIKVVKNKGIEITSGSGVTTGYALVDGKVKYFKVENDKVIYDESKNSLNTLEESIYNFGNYEILKDENLYQFFKSSYYGANVSFNSALATQITHSIFQNVDFSKHINAFGINYNSNDNSIIEVKTVYQNGSSLGMSEITCTSVGSTVLQFIK